MSNDIAIKVENLSKVYRLYDKPADRLKESLHPLRKKYHRDFYALNDVSFEVKKGETVGIIGKNGSGKSTLLKIITGVLTPTSGNVTVNGRVSALLELGAGFNPEYTGVENIYLNGTLMGYSREEMDAKVKDILEFADIGDFVNQPVKMYSSGMFARLAFAVAINVDPDILIVDEALSVGDVFFQNKCFHKFEDFKEQGKTILFVSHDIGSIKQLCSNVLWLDEGGTVEYNDKEKVCAKYLNYQIRDNNKIVKLNSKVKRICQVEEKILQADVYQIPKIDYKIPTGGTGEVDIISFFAKDELCNLVSIIEVEKYYTFHIVAKFNNGIENVIFGFQLENLKGIQIIDINSHVYEKTLEFAEIGILYEAVFKVRIPKIQKGAYLISAAVATGTQKKHVVLNWHHNIKEISIENPGYNLSLIELDGEVDIIKHREEDIELV